MDFAAFAEKDGAFELVRSLALLRPDWQRHRGFPRRLDRLETDDILIITKLGPPLEIRPA